MVELDEVTNQVLPNHMFSDGESGSGKDGSFKGCPKLPKRSVWLEKWRNLLLLMSTWATHSQKVKEITAPSTKRSEAH